MGGRGGSDVEKDASEGWTRWREYVAARTATLRASVPADDAGVCVESGVGHPLVHAAIHEARNAHDPATTRIQRAKLAEGAHAVTLLCAVSDSVGGKRNKCHGTKDEMHCSRHRDAAVRAEPAPIQPNKSV